MLEKKGIKVQFHFKKNQEIMAAAYASERPLFLDSFIKLKIHGL